MSPEIEGINLCHRIEENSFLLPEWRKFRASGRRMRGDKTTAQLPPDPWLKF